MIMCQTNPNSMPRKAELCDLNKLFRLNEFVAAASLSIPTLMVLCLSAKQAVETQK